MKIFRLAFIAATFGLVAGCSTLSATSAQTECTTALASLSALEVTPNLTAQGQADLATITPLVNSACPGGVPVQSAAYFEETIIPQLAVILAEHL